MDSTVDAMEAAYDALVDAAAAAVCEPGRAALVDQKRCLDAFNECCDRAEGLVQAAGTGLGPAPAATDEEEVQEKEAVAANDN